jgi:glycosyltransferase involved in cell wall biosynthesis
MDFLVLPSLTEGLPNVVLEAFSFGKPVVATRVGGVPELVTDGVNGIIVPPGDPASLAAGISRFLRDKAFAKMMGEEGYRTVVESFTFEEQSQKLQAIYSQLLSEPPR